MGVYVDIYAEYNSPKSGKSGEWHAVPLFLKDIDQGEDERLKLAFLHAGQGMTEMHITSLPDDVCCGIQPEHVSKEVREAVSLECTVFYEIDISRLRSYASAEGDCEGYVLDSEWEAFKKNGDEICDILYDRDFLEAKSAKLIDQMKDHRRYRRWMDPDGTLAFAKDLVGSVNAMMRMLHWSNLLIDDDVRFRLIAAAQW